jgi:predicted DNA-binding protein (UPF0251 family)
MKRLYREAFRRAFHEALDMPEVRERNILRQHVLDGMTFEQMGRLYGVHRATVCRWMSAVHQKLLTGTRQKLTETRTAPCWGSSAATASSSAVETTKTWRGLRGMRASTAQDQTAESCQTAESWRGPRRIPLMTSSACGTTMM